MRLDGFCPVRSRRLPLSSEIRTDQRGSGGHTARFAFDMAVEGCGAAGMSLADRVVGSWLMVLEAAGPVNVIGYR